MTGVLAVDAGKTHTRVARYVDGRREATAQGPGVENIAAPDGPERVSAALRAAVEGLPCAAAPDRVVVGSTGLMLPSRHAATYADLVARVTGAPDVIVTSDVVTTFTGTLGLRTGAVVAAGTGTIALGIGPERHVQVDGWGYLVGDGGSGFAIGRQGLVEALRALDGRGGAPALRDAALASFGHAGDIVDAVYGADNPVRLVAGFAREVATAAHAGDEAAFGIWRDAVRELVDTTLAAVDGAGLGRDAAVAWNGGLFAEERLLRDPFVTALRERRPTLDVRAPAGDALEGAYLLSHAEADLPPALRPLLHRREVMA